jgi:hypothetical protein
VRERNRGLLSCALQRYAVANPGSINLRDSSSKVSDGHNQLETTYPWVLRRDHCRVCAFRRGRHGGHTATRYRRECVQIVNLDAEEWVTWRHSVVVGSRASSHMHHLNSRVAWALMFGKAKLVVRVYWTRASRPTRSKEVVTASAICRMHPNNSIGPDIELRLKIEVYASRELRTTQRHAFTASARA